MPIDPFFGGIAAAGVSGGLDILSGFLSQPDQSQRDLMWEGQKIWEMQARKRYPLQVESLRRAHLNPILAVSQPPPAASAPSASQPYTNPMGAAISKAGSSALSAFMRAQEARQIMADTKLKEAQATTAEADANLKREQAKTEPERRWQLQASADQASSAADLADQQRLVSQINEKIAAEDLEVAKKDAIVAGIEAEVYSSSIGELTKWLSTLGVRPGAARVLGNLIMQYAARRKRR